MKKELIQKIVKASGVTPGELILIHFWGEDSDKWIANEFLIAVTKCGAAPVLLQEARTLNRDIFSNADDSCFGETYFSMLSGFDAVLDVFAYQPIVLGYEIEKEKFARYRKYMAQLFSVLMKAKRFTQIRIPTENNAVESGLEPTEYIHRMERAYDIDYDKLMSSCIQTKKMLEPQNHLVLRSGNDCKLFFDVTDRAWHIDAGDGDWPCGEIYIAPKESKTNGTVFFSRLFIEDIGEYSNVTLTVSEGNVIASDNEDVTVWLQSLSPENTVVCELGLGMNPNVTDLCGYTVLDEKMANSFHIAIGANNMFGGENAADIHMDFVGTDDFELSAIDGGTEYD